MIRGRRLAAIGLGIFVGMGLIVGASLYISDLKGQVSEQRTTITRNERTQCPPVHPDPSRCRALLQRLLKYGTRAQHRAVQRAATRAGRVVPSTSPTGTNRGVSAPSRGVSRGGNPPQRQPGGPSPSPPPNLVQQLLDTVHRVTCPLLPPC